MDNQKCTGYFLYFLHLCFSQCTGKMEPFVVGGDDTKISRYPHSVFLNIDCDSNWVCGSSILNQRIILTAAHCLFGCRRNWNIEAYAGHENLNKVIVVRVAIKFVQHEKYNDKTMTNDIAILYLKTSLPLGRYIQRVTIKRTHSLGQLASVAGWGVINRVTNVDSVVLKTVRQKLMSRRSCARFGYLATGMMCAESVVPNTSPASGDSGSALVTPDLQQLGLVSFIFTEYPNTPIYTNVSFYYNWLKRNARMLYCN